jgi:tripartite ATP-independent transporter DctM subunit
MKKAGFSAQFSAAITAASSLIGPIIPPSICFVVYASLTNVSVGKMFLGGFIPGVIMGVLMMIQCWYMAKKHNYPCYPRARVREVIGGIVTSLPALMMPAIIILGIGFGFFTPTESAAVAVAYGLIYSIIVKTFRIKNFIRQLYKSALTTSATMIIVGGATLLGYLLTIEGTPRMIVAFLAGASDNPYIVMLAIGGFLLIVGMFMSLNAALVILIPIFIPIVQHFQLDPVWFGVLTCLWLGIGLVTPPVCSCLQLACKIADISLMDGFKATLPFFFMLVLMCTVITFFPAIITFLPNLLMP